MERLTDEKQIGPFASLKDKAEAVPGAFGTYDCLYAHMVAVTRLKEYEDTGLEPEEIKNLKSRALMGALETPEMEEYSGSALERADRLIAEYESIGPIDHLRELAQAEKDGRLVVLPCKLHEPIFYIADGDWCDDVPYEVDIGQRQGEWKDGLLFECEDGFGFYGEDIGKTVFLTREEAEAALKKRE